MFFFFESFLEYVKRKERIRSSIVDNSEGKRLPCTAPLRTCGPSGPGCDTVPVLASGATVNDISIL